MKWPGWTRWKRALAAPFVLLAAVIVLLEDWLWDDLQRMAAALGRLIVFRQIEALIIQLPPYAALLVFALPSLLLAPVKLAALWLLAHGQPVLGFLTVAVAKVAGTALVARLYVLTEPRLLQIGWFATLRGRFLDFKARVYGVIRATAVYRLTHQWKTRIRTLWRNRRQGAWRRRWLAAVKLSRAWKKAE
ncbi:MAG: hypothetical protein ACKV2V_24325 [Blastocatellia bacterium]